MSDTSPTTTPAMARTIAIPGGRTAVIRKLNWTQIKAAGKAQTTESLALMREMGAELIRAFREAKGDAGEKAADQMEAAQKALARKASQYETATILLDGVVSVEGMDPLSVQDLDPATAEALHEAIVAFAWEVPEKNG